MSFPAYQTILLQQNDGQCHIQLNRPEKRNALNSTMVKELTDAFTRIREERQIRSVLIKGNERAFCSGADLEFLQQMRDFSYQENMNDSKTLGNLFLEIYTCPKPVLALVEGPALAGGCGLATVCDFVYATPQARFGYPEVRIGFIAALVSAFLIRQIGERQARELLLTGNILSAIQAKNIGLINHVFSEKEIHRQAQELIHRLEQNSSEAMAQSKALVNHFIYTHIEDEIQHLAEINARFRKSDDFVEGISAFLEKRKPNWVHQK